MASDLYDIMAILLSKNITKLLYNVAGLDMPPGLLGGLVGGPCYALLSCLWCFGEDVYGYSIMRDLVMPAFFGAGSDLPEKVSMALLATGAGILPCFA